MLPCLMSLDFCCDIQMVGSKYGVNNMKAWIYLALYQQGAFSWNTLQTLLSIEHRLNATAFLSIVADHVYAFMTTVYHLLMATSSGITQHVTKLKSAQTGLLNMRVSSLNSNDLHSHQISMQIELNRNVVESEIYIMDVQPINLQQLCEAIISIWTKISEECFQHKLSLRQKGVPNKVTIECIMMGK